MTKNRGDKMNKSKLLLGGIFFLTFAISLFSQSGELKYQKKMIGSDLNIRIYFSDENGNESISSDLIANSLYFYFCFSPIGNWTFTEKDIKKYAKPIQLMQEGNVIPNISLNPIQEGGIIPLIVLSFNKNDLDYTKYFYFESDLGQTELMNIPEEYWPIYVEYKPFFLQGREAFETQEYLKAFQVLKNFLVDDPRVKALSFYETADSLNREAVNNYITENENKLKEITEEIEKSLDKGKIDRLVMLSMELSLARQNFSSYFNYKGEIVFEIQQKFDQLIENLNNRISESNVTYRDMKLSIFETGNYIDYKFELFVDLLAKLILDIEFIKKIEGYNEIDLALIDKYTTKKQELEELDWLAEFTEVLKLINEDIKNKSYILSASAIENLENQKQFEKQPYHNIFMAFNELASSDRETFVKYIKETFKTVTDEDLLYIFELWYISYLATINNISEKVLVSLADGINYENDGNFEEAIKQYKIALRLSSGFSPPMFFLGRIYHKKGEGFTAERYFAQALEIFPEYMAPRIYKIRFLIESEDYTSALNEVNSALTNSPHWYFYFNKAQILVHLKRNQEARDVLLGKCMTLNDYHFDSYILLGDICVSIEDGAGAKEYYLKAGNIDPESQTFINRMNELKNIKFPEPPAPEEVPEPGDEKD